MDVLKINEHHQSVLNGYSQLNRYQRQQYLKSVQASIKDVIKSKLLEDTYTRDEVTEIIKNMQNLIVDDLESELINILQTNMLMLCQLFQQAEKWHLQLSIDLSEMQNKELLEGVKHIENIPTKLDKPKLSPLSLNVEKTSEVLRLEISNLQKENQQLAEDMKNLQDKMLELRQEQDNISVKSEEKDKIIISLEDVIEKKNQEEERLRNEQKNTDSEKILEDYDKVLAEQIGHELEEMKKKVDAAQAQLTLAEMELEKKFNNTAAYNNMKKIISKKNEQIKELRSHLSKYEALDNLEMGTDKEEKETE
ncbi:leucine zipper transcription factor-like protein 1 isoform X2 [Planococcus citri]|uniref:leucine zipper transcription factor-like protein 1 isoform X2 n=1 Tax=Planococcus citri TaxID=170843 RepID=UPI0031F79CD6